MTNTALQVTNFDFYGDDLIALQDNSTGEIYTAITHVLRGIGFTSKQIEHQQNKILADEIFKTHTLKFSGVDLNIPSINEIWCISQRKLPLALAKINITPAMKKKQPELSERLLKYQDKCADVLASVFIDHKTINQPNIQPLIDSITILTQTITTMQQDINSLKELQSTNKLPEKKYSRWKTNTFKKLNTLLSYVNANSEENLKLSEIIHLVIQETEDTYLIEINDYVDAYKSEFNLDVNPYAIDVINHYKDVRDMFTCVLNSIMDKLHLTTEDATTKNNIFNILANNINSNVAM